MSDVAVMDAPADTGTPTVETGSTVTDSASSPSAPPTELAGGESATESVGQPRDDRGRFAPRDTTAASASPSPAGEANKTGQPPVAGPPPSPDAAPPVEGPKPSPYSIKVGGQDYGIEGAEYTPGKGLFIPEAQIPTVSRVLQEGAYKLAHWERELTTERTKAEQAGYDRAMNSPELAAQKKAFDLFLELIKPGNEEKLVEFVKENRVQGPLLLERAKAAALQAQLDQRTNAEKKQKGEQESRALAQQKDQHVVDLLASIRRAPEVKGLTADDWKEIDKYVAWFAPKLWVEHQGQWYFDPDGRIASLVQDRIASRQAAVEQQKKLTDAAAFNGKQNGGKGASPPPAVPAGKPSQPGASARPWESITDPDERKAAWQKHHGINQ